MTRTAASHSQEVGFGRISLGALCVLFTFALTFFSGCSREYALEATADVYHSLQSSPPDLPTAVEELFAPDEFAILDVRNTGTRTATDVTVPMTSHVKYWLVGQSQVFGGPAVKMGSLGPGQRARAVLWIWGHENLGSTQVGSAEHAATNIAISERVTGAAAYVVRELWRGTIEEAKSHWLRAVIQALAIMVVFLGLKNWLERANVWKRWRNERPGATWVVTVGLLVALFGFGQLLGRSVEAPEAATTKPPRHVLLPLSPDRAAGLRAKYPGLADSPFWQLSAAKKAATESGFSCEPKPHKIWDRTTDDARFYEKLRRGGGTVGDVRDVLPIRTMWWSCADPEGNKLEFEADEAGGVLLMFISGLGRPKLEAVLAHAYLTPPLPAPGVEQAMSSYFGKYESKAAAIAAKVGHRAYDIGDYTLLDSWFDSSPGFASVTITYRAGSGKGRNPMQAVMEPGM